jgi:hypothetical protein
MIPASLYKQYPNLFKEIVNNSNIDDITNQLEDFPINNVNEILYLVQKIETLTNNNSIKEKIYSNPILTSKTLQYLSQVDELFILDKQAPILQKILDRVKNHNKSIHSLMNVRNTIKEEVK